MGLNYSLLLVPKMVNVFKFRLLYRKVKTILHRFYIAYYALLCKLRQVCYPQIEGLIICPRQIVGEQYISIQKGTIIENDAILTAWDTYLEQKFHPSIQIGRNCNIGEHVHITACDSVVIGDNVLTGRYVYISDNAHGASDRSLLDIHPLERPLSVKGATIIEDNVWLGERVCILSGVRIGRGAIIAANAVVTHDIPPYCVAGGVPAKVIKKMSND